MPASGRDGGAGAGLPVVDETELQRWRRNYNELLQELRVAQTGVQILFAFLLILAFTPGFDPSDGFVRGVYLAALLSAAAAAGFIIAPVSHHRLLFRRRRKPLLVRYASRMALAGLALVMVAMVSAVLLATDTLLPRGVAVGVAALSGAWFVALWWLLPVRLRRATAREPEPVEVGDDGPP